MTTELLEYLLVSDQCSGIEKKNTGLTTKSNKLMVLEILLSQRKKKSWYYWPNEKLPILHTNTTTILTYVVEFSSLHHSF